MYMYISFILYVVYYVCGSGGTSTDKKENIAEESRNTHLHENRKYKGLGRVVKINHRLVSYLVVCIVYVYNPEWNFLYMDFSCLFEWMGVSRKSYKTQKLSFTLNKINLPFYFSCLHKRQYYIFVMLWVSKKLLRVQEE